MRGVARKLLRYATILPWLALGQCARRPSSPAPALLAGKSVLVLQLNALGDALMTTPLLQNLKHANPGMRLEVLSRESSCSIFLATPHCDAVHSLRRHHAWHNLRTWYALRRTRFDLVIDCTALVNSACYTRSLKPHCSVGFTRKVSVGLGAVDIAPYYGVAMPYSETENASRLSLQLADKWLGEDCHVGMTFRVESTAQEFALDWFHQRRIAPQCSIILHPGAKWPPRRWPEEYWARLCDLLLQANPGYIPILVGSHEDTAIIERILQLTNADVTTLVGRSFQEVAGVMARSHAIVCNDSFSMHLGAALRRPVVALFGPGHPARTGPVGKSNTLLYGATFCSPCEQYYTANRCWRGLNFCMYSIKPEHVMESLKTIT